MGRGIKEQKNIEIAKQLADAGVATEVIEEILDQVAALREGRG